MSGFSKGLSSGFNTNLGISSPGGGALSLTGDMGSGADSDSAGGREQLRLWAEPFVASTVTVLAIMNPGTNRFTERADIVTDTSVWRRPTSESQPNGAIYSTTTGALRTSPGGYYAVVTQDDVDLTAYSEMWISLRLSKDQVGSGTIIKQSNTTGLETYVWSVNATATSLNVVYIDDSYGLGDYSTDTLSTPIFDHDIMIHIDLSAVGAHGTTFTEWWVDGVEHTPTNAKNYLSLSSAFYDKPLRFLNTVSAGIDYVRIITGSLSSDARDHLISDPFFGTEPAAPLMPLFGSDDSVLNADRSLYFVPSESEMLAPKQRPIAPRPGWVPPPDVVYFAYLADDSGTQCQNGVFYNDEPIGSPYFDAMPVRSPRGELGLGSTSSDGFAYALVTFYTDAVYRQFDLGEAPATTIFRASMTLTTGTGEPFWLWAQGDAPIGFGMTTGTILSLYTSVGPNFTLAFSGYDGDRDANTLILPGTTGQEITFTCAVVRTAADTFKAYISIDGYESGAPEADHADIIWDTAPDYGAASSMTWMTGHADHDGNPYVFYGAVVHSRAMEESEIRTILKNPELMFDGGADVPTALDVFGGQPTWPVLDDTTAYNVTDTDADVSTLVTFTDD